MVVWSLLWISRRLVESFWSAGRLTGARGAHSWPRPPRRFCCAASPSSTSSQRRRAHLLEGASFEDAALLFAEDRHAEGDGELSLVVEDCETGERQCFRIDLGTGRAGPCDEA